MTDTTYQKFIQRWEEVTELPPQTLGPFTGIYKGLVRRFKVMPWPWFMLVSVAVVFVLFMVLGPALTSIVTLLQKAF